MSSASSLRASRPSGSPIRLRRPYSLALTDDRPACCIAQSSLGRVPAEPPSRCARACGPDGGTRCMFLQQRPAGLFARPLISGTKVALAAAESAANATLAARRTPSRDRSEQRRFDCGDLHQRQDSRHRRDECFADVAVQDIDRGNGMTICSPCSARPKSCCG